jgi:hypothetical protein
MGVKPDLSLQEKNMHLWWVIDNKVLNRIFGPKSVK